MGVRAALAPTHSLPSRRHHHARSLDQYGLDWYLPPEPAPRGSGLLPRPQHLKHTRDPALARDRLPARGVVQRIALRTEFDVFSFLGLAFIPPSERCALSDHYPAVGASASAAAPSRDELPSDGE